MKLLHLMLLVIVALAATGCASRGPVAITKIQNTGCDTAWKLDGAELVRLDTGRPETHRFDAASRCLAESDGAAASYAVFRLPRFRESWTLEVDSQIDGRRLFAPEVLMLDAEGKLLRQLPYDRFTMRGDRTQAMVFFSEENAAERYVLVRSATQAVGRDERRVVSGSFMVPILTGIMPFLYMQGTESEGAYTLAHDGLVNLWARSSHAPRRLPQARDIARSELGAFTR